MNPDGRYIPYSGGCMGWFENSGVMKAELPNDYTFDTVLDAPTVRRVLFEREGEAGDAGASRRSEERITVEREVHVTILHGSDSYQALTKDVSPHGLRLQFLVDIATIQKSDSCKVQLRREEGQDDELLEIESTVMWIARVGTRRPVTNIGIGFTQITDETQGKLTKLLLE